MCVEKPRALQSERILEAREGRSWREKRGDEKHAGKSQRDKELRDGGGVAAGEGM